MQKQCTKKTYNKRSWSKRVHIKKQKMQKGAKKNKQNAKQQFKNAKQKRTKRTENAHAQPNFTHHLFCAMFFDVCPSYVRFFGMCFAFLCFLFCGFSVFSRKRKKNAKKDRKQTQIQSKTNAKVKTRTLLIAFVLLFDCICFACFVHVCCICCAFLLHCLCRFCICLVDKFEFLVTFCLLFCIPRHPLVTCFGVFCACFSGLVLHVFFCIVYAFSIFCCVIRTSFSVHHKSCDR